MDYNKEKADEVCLALLILTSFEEKGIIKDEPIRKAWKGMAWEVLGRLYEKGYISDPKNKNGERISILRLHSV